MTVDLTSQASPDFVTVLSLAATAYQEQNNNSSWSWWWTSIVDSRTLNP
ncbi:MAG: hypothetical protein KME30_11440 [Iphinoe sp. HA4291-MV1]|jgi:hypothetical protein|nr:hypothetical protein [Iphinoe sp. HA4291-MV1]